MVKLLLLLHINSEGADTTIKAQCRPFVQVGELRWTSECMLLYFRHMFGSFHHLLGDAALREPLHLPFKGL